MLTNWWRKMLKRSWTVDFLLWILAVVLVVSGIMAVTRKQYLQGAILIIVGLLVGPGGTSIFQ
jgi:hypothetical protein